VYERQGDGGNAYRQLVRAAELLPDNAEVQIKAGRYHLLAGASAAGRGDSAAAKVEFDRAKLLADDVLKKDPKNVDAMMVLANAIARENLKGLPAAIEKLENAVELDPKRIDTYLNLAQFEAFSGDPAKAEAVLRGALSADPNSVDARLALAELYAKTGDFVKAETSLKEVLALKPSHAVASQGLALIYIRTGKIKEAEAPLRAVAESSKELGARLFLAQYYLAAGRTADALPILNALAKEPQGLVPASTLLARLDYAEGRRPEAHKRIDQLLEQQPTNARVLLLKSQMLAADGKLDEALVKSQAAATADPKFDGARYLIGLIYLRKNDSEQALKAFNEALSLNPASREAALQVAKLHLSSGRADLALPLVEGLVTRQPDDLEAKLTLVRALLQKSNPTSEDLKRAETEAASILAKAPASGDAQAVVGAVAAVKKDLPAARAAFTRALEMNSSSVAALSGLVNLDLAAGKRAEARARIEKHLVADPKNPALLELAGRTYMALGDATKAEEVWRKLLEVQPSSLVPYGALGQIFYAQGRLDDARREFERYAEKQPTAVGAHTLVAIILQMQNRIPEAQQRYERTLQINPRAAVAANNLAWLYAEQNTNLDVALQLAQTAKAQMPESPEVDDTLGWVYYKRELPDLAISSFKKSLEKDPANPSYLYHLGLAHLKKGDKVQARESLEKALRAKPNFPEAAEAKRLLAGIS
jgi:tetratricopeptide (TPR) repeat protein